VPPERLHPAKGVAVERRRERVEKGGESEHYSPLRSLVNCERVDILSSEMRNSAAKAG